MEAPERKAQMVYFEAGGSRFAIDAAELAGVAMGCPFAVYDGLPAGVCAIVHWSGKIFPVLGAFLDPEKLEEELRAATFLFSIEGLGGPYPEVAVAVPDQVRVLITEAIETSGVIGGAPGVVAAVRDKFGTDALQVSLAKLSRAAKGAKKNAA